MPHSSLTGRVASLTRWYAPDDPRVIAAVQELRTERLMAHVRAVVDTAPPLTAEQRARIASLLGDRPEPGTGAA